MLHTCGKNAKLWAAAVLRVRVCACAGLRMRFYLVVHVLELAVHGRRALGEQKV